MGLPRYDVGLQAMGSELSVQVFAERKEAPDGPYHLVSEVEAYREAVEAMIEAGENVGGAYPCHCGDASSGPVCEWCQFEKALARVKELAGE